MHVCSTGWRSMQLPYARLCLRKPLLLHGMFLVSPLVILCYNMLICLNGDLKSYHFNLVALLAIHKHRGCGVEGKALGDIWVCFGVIALVSCSSQANSSGVAISHDLCAEVLCCFPRRATTSATPATRSRATSTTFAFRGPRPRPLNSPRSEQ